MYCRDNPEAEKVSLHALGRQHISVRREVAKRLGLGTRFGNVWFEPEFEPEAIATFSLLFPPWSVGLELADIPKQGKKDELFIVGHREKVVVVAFFIVDADRNIQGRVPHIVLGRLPLREGKTLYLIAWKEPQRDLMDRVRRVFPQASWKCSELGLDDGEYAMCVQGYRQPNSAYMVVVPVHYTSPESKQIIKDNSVMRPKALGALPDG